MAWLMEEGDRSSREDCLEATSMLNSRGGRG